MADDRPDFDALRAARDAKLRQLVEEICREHGWDPDKVGVHVSPGGCYCACPDGPCEHDFQGWREFEDGLGGEQVCTRCGMGAMSHSLHTGE